MKPQIPGRWHAHGLDGPRFTSGADVVEHLGAVQSQLPDMALWAIGRRSGQSLADLQAEFDHGDFIRTHVLRPTWHYVIADDVFWLQALSAPRVHRLDAQQRRNLKIDDALLTDAKQIATTALSDGPMTRTALAEALTGVGSDVSGIRMAHVAMYLELECIIASGPMDGKQHTYQLLPGKPAEEPSRDELLATVARRYARGHGSFRDRDLAWWASLTLTEARRAIDLAELRVATIDGETYAVPATVVDADPAHATLLPNFDEYMSYARDPDDFAQTADSPQEIVRGTGVLLVDGALAGRWTRTVRATTVDVDVVCQPRMTRALRLAIEQEAEAFGTFLDRESRLGISD